MSRTPIDATLIASNTLERPEVSFHHRRFRGFATAAHQHDEAQLLIPLNGRMHMVAGGRSQMLAPDSAVWLPPGLVHRFIHVDGQLEFLAVEFDPKTSLPVPLRATEPTQPLVARAPGIKLLAQTMACELEAPGADDPRVLLGCMELVIVCLERALLQGSAPPVAASPEIGLVIEAVLAGYAEDLRVPALAAMVGLSPRQLERRFHDELGRTPKRFLMEVRVEAAETLLRTTEHPIAQIALDVGFQTPSHFTGTFKALTGRPPNAVRSEALPPA